MRTDSILLWTAALAAFCAAGGCQSPPRAETARPTPVIEAHRAASPITIDGRLDEPAWGQASPIPYHLLMPGQKQPNVRKLEEPGTVRLLWDDRFLYLGFEFTDTDVVDFSKQDNQRLYSVSDVAEIFLKPSDQTWYWEFHVTPTGKVATYFWPGRGWVGLPMEEAGVVVSPRFLQVATRVQGTVNDWHDRDEGWVAEVAIPIEKLYRDGSSKRLGPNWTILLGRYNYSRYRQRATGPELSSVPALSQPNYHLTDEYARLRLVE